jgi:hypothetical protein
VEDEDVRAREVEDEAAVVLAAGLAIVVPVRDSKERTVCETMDRSVEGVRNGAVTC